MSGLTEALMAEIDRIVITLKRLSELYDGPEIDEDDLEEGEMMNVLTEAIIEELERTNYEGATVLLFDEDCDWGSVIFG